MSCDQCREREAVIHLTQIVNEQVTTLHLCERCAAEKGVESPSGVAKTPLGSFLAAMGKNLPETVPAPRAGRDLRALRRVAPGFPGERPAGLPRMLPLVRGAAPGPPPPAARLHPSRGRALRRAGRRPPPTAGWRSADLREQLRLAVETENFELAAELRDRLRVLE